MRLGPMTVDELRDELHRWTPAPIARRVVRGHIDALTRRGLLAWSGDRALVPADIEARCRREGVRLRWLADSAGRGLSLDAMLCLAFRAERVTEGSLPFAWTDALRWTADRLGIGVDKVTAAERELEAAGILGAGAHPAKRTRGGRERGHRRRPLSGGIGSVRLGPPCTNRSQSPNALTAHRIAGDQADHSLGIGRLGLDDESVAERPAGGASLRSAVQGSNTDTGRTGTRATPPDDWLTRLEAEQRAAQAADLAADDSRARLAVLRGLSALLVADDGPRGILGVLTAAGVHVDPARPTSEALRARRRVVAEQLVEAGVDSRDLLAWCLLALRLFGRSGPRVSHRAGGRTVYRPGAGIRSLGAYLCRAFAAVLGEGRRDPHDALSGLLWVRLRRLLGRDAEPRDVLPARLRGAEPVRIGELLGVEFVQGAGPRRIDELFRPAVARELDPQREVRDAELVRIWRRQRAAADRDAMREIEDAGDYLRRLTC